MSSVLPVVAASALLLAAVLLVVPGGVRGRLRVVARPVGVGHAGSATTVPRLLGARRRPGAARRSTTSLFGVVLLVAAVLAVAVAGPVGGGAVLAYGIAGRRAYSRRSRARADDTIRALGAVALAGLADDLRAGRTPLAALHAAVAALERGPVTPPVATALAAIRSAVVRHPPGDVVAALRAVPGPLAPALHRLAAAWTLTDCGIPLAEVVGQLDVELRRLGRMRERAAARTASARTTARLVAGLPILGLGLGQLLGAQPYAVLTGTTAGAACAAVAIALHLTGFWLADRLGRVVVE
ncbi:hypothetical protein [Cryptosporangium aurantiacum]|uniref:Tight adherence protein B n=1 Tax=Cryptosporangium aurantiacum TaxID=134849 RepID=A0A1M7NG71_9ACTN|nr:hypothetical protein [Cryptosporangium aurantiacum]SHN02769.1 tight adherence protein B [Cryptosporangium aurantiacum]